MKNQLSFRIYLQTLLLKDIKLIIKNKFTINKIKQKLTTGYNDLNQI